MWRGLSGLLVALTLVLLAAGPTLDAWLCRDDVAAHGAAGSSLQADTGISGDFGDESPACVQGHCHHVAPLGSPSAVSGASLGSAAYRHPRIEVALPPGLRPFELMRPPRA